MASKSYSSEEIAQIVEHIQPCKFFDMNTQQPIIWVSYYVLYKPGSRVLCNPDALAQIKSALEKAYADGVREVGMIAPPILQDALITMALSVTSDPTWKIYPHVELSYAKTLLEVKQKIWDKAVLNEQINMSIEEMQKEICDNLGFTDEVIDELLDYKDAKSVQELPEHLRKLFSDGQSM